MLITAENDLERTIEIYILTIDIRCAIIRLELADACLDHADAHHKQAKPITTAIKKNLPYKNTTASNIKNLIIKKNQ